MSKSDFELPESMQPIIDARYLAADLTHSYRLLRITRGEIPEEEDAGYICPTADEFSPANAGRLVAGLCRWAFDSPREGFLQRAEFAETRQLVGRAAALTKDLQGLDTGSVKVMIREFDEYEARCHELYKSSNNYSLERDNAYYNDEMLSFHAARVLHDFIIPDNQGIKDTLFSGFVDDHWSKLFEQGS